MGPPAERGIREGRCRNFELHHELRHSLLLDNPPQLELRLIQRAKYQRLATKVKEMVDLRIGIARISWLLGVSVFKNAFKPM
jgi:hypothetical protein